MKVSANLSVQMYTECPHCNEQIDLFDDSEAGDVNEEGRLWDVIQTGLAEGIVSGCWEDLNIEVECQKCLKTFVFDSLEY